MCSVARAAGIQAAKRASDLIPLCHPLMVGAVTVNFEINHDSIEVEARSTPSTAPVWRWKRLRRVRSRR